LNDAPSPADSDQVQLWSEIPDRPLISQLKWNERRTGFLE
jgi:hypothetical protein